MSKLKINISIANRIYPLTIDREEEEAFRAAAVTIDKIIKKYEENYAVRDKQDLLAMASLQFAVRLSSLESSAVSVDKEVAEKLDELNKLLSDTISE